MPGPPALPGKRPFWLSSVDAAFVKERDALHKEHQGRMAKFKKRMEVALDLIHTIQDEMGTRHSELVERLKGDIVSTQARLKKYLDRPRCRDD